MQNRGFSAILQKTNRGLLEDLAAAPTLAGLHLGDAARFAPEAPGGLNIEGLAAMPDGSLLVGFRNPVPNGRALLVPLLNPSELVTAVSGRKARFGEPILLELRGRGYWIVAEPASDASVFTLYRWSGKTRDWSPIGVVTLNPERECVAAAVDAAAAEISAVAA